MYRANGITTDVDELGVFRLDVHVSFHCIRSESGDNVIHKNGDNNLMLRVAVDIGLRETRQESDSFKYLLVLLKP